MSVCRLVKYMPPDLQFKSWPADYKILLESKIMDDILLGK